MNGHRPGSRLCPLGDKFFVKFDDRGVFGKYPSKGIGKLK